MLPTIVSPTDESPALRLLVRRILPWAALGGLLAGVALAYSPSLDGEFVFDDQLGILQNPRIRDLDGYLRTSNLRSLLSGRPLTDVTFALDYLRGGLDGRVFHESNLAIHLVTVVLVFLLTSAVARRARFEAGGRGFALAVAAIFGLHPIQAEAVAYVSQRAEALASLLAAATLLLLLRADRARRPVAAAALRVAAVALYGLAISAKPSVVAVPALYVLASVALPEYEGEYAASGGATRGAWVGRGAALLSMFALAGLQAVYLLESLQGRGDVGYSIRDLGPWRYLLTEARVIPLYLRLLIWPAGLNADHDVALSDGLLTPWTTLAGGLLSLGLVGVAAVGLVRARRRSSHTAQAIRVASFGVAWFFLALAPTSSVVPVTDVAAEHRVYLAAWGIFAAVAALAMEAARALPPRARRPALAGTVVCAAIVLAVALYVRAGVWATAVDLWTDAAAKSPRKARVQVNLGHARHERGDLRGALAAYESALALEDRTRIPALAIHNMATALAGLGRLDEARAILLRQQPPEPETFVLRVDLELASGRIEEAAEAAAFVVRFASEYPRAHQAAAKVALAKGDLPAARTAYQRSLMLRPADPGVLLEIGRIEERLGDAQSACERWRAAVRSPGNRWASRWASAELARVGCP